MEENTTKPTEYVDVQREAVESAAVEEQKKISSDKKTQDKQTFPIPKDLPFDAYRPAFNKQSMLFLCGTTAGTSNWAIFVAILSRMTMVDTIDTSSGRKVELKVGQANCSLSQLEKEWGISRKVLRKTFDQMETLGLIERAQSREASIVTFTSIWACEQLKPTFSRFSNRQFKSPSVPKLVTPSAKPQDASKIASKPDGNVPQDNSPADGK